MAFPSVVNRKHGSWPQNVFGHRCKHVVPLPMPVQILSNELKNADGRTRWYNYQYSSIMGPYRLPRASAGDNQPARFGASLERY